MVRPNAGDSGSNLHQLEGINPSELQISYLENVRIPGEAIGIELCNKENLSKLTLHWTMDKDVLGALVPPNGLKHLELNGYSSISFPNWFMDITHYLPILVSFKLKNLLSCSSLPPLGQLPNLKELYLERLSSIAKIGGDFCGRKRAFLQLSRFTLLKMERLEEWTTTYCSEVGTEEFMCPVLDELVISNCPRLRLKPCPPIFRRWTISHSDEVLNSGDEEGNFSHFNNSTPRTRFLVWSQSYYCGSWRLLGHLPTLQELEIKRPSQMTSLPESVRQLASLRFLELYKCNDISVLPEWLGDLKSLERLRILGCGKIKSMPPSVQQLTKLPELKQWCESEENKSKLAHVKDIVSYSSYTDTPCYVYSLQIPLYFCIYMTLAQENKNKR